MKCKHRWSNVEGISIGDSNHNERNNCIGYVCQDCGRVKKVKQADCPCGLRTGDKIKLQCMIRGVPTDDFKPQPYGSYYAGHGPMGDFEHGVRMMREGK